MLELRDRKVERHGELAEETSRTLEMTFRICWIARQPRLEPRRLRTQRLWIPSGRKAVDGSDELLGLGDVVQLQRGLDRNDECFLDVLDRDTHHVADAEGNLGEAQGIGGIPTRQKQTRFPTCKRRLLLEVGGGLEFREGLEDSARLFIRSAVDVNENANRSEDVEGEPAFGPLLFRSLCFERQNLVPAAESEWRIALAKEEVSQ